VPNEAAGLVRALLTADRNQRFARSRMSELERRQTPEVDFTPYIIADADTGHGGDAHVRNLVRRFAEAGVPGYHIEDQRPGTKKCGHQGGKVLVGSDEQIKRLNAARFQLDTMGVPGIIVARTDAEAANLVDSASDERDQPFVLGATNIAVPPYRIAFLAVMKRLYDAGVEDLNGFMLYDVPEGQAQAATLWLERSGVAAKIDETAKLFADGKIGSPEEALDEATNEFVDAWESDSGLTTYGQAVADAMAFREEEGAELPMSQAEWLEFAGTASWFDARAKASEMGIDITFSPELAMTPEGYYQVRGGIPYAVQKSLAAAPYADILWMETKTADLEDAREFAEAVHAVYPEKMLAYNLSPSFNWDTTGMTEDQMREFPADIGKLGFVFNFMTYGGHQIDGLAAEEFAGSLREDGMLALARLQRKFRLVDSPYRTPQTLVGGPRADAALAAASGQTATTKAMGKGSTQTQHLVQTEVPPKVLAGWLADWADHYDVRGPFKVSLRPHTPGSSILELAVLNPAGDKVADVIFDTIQDRRGRSILSVRDQNTHDESLRRKRLMTLLHLYLIKRYKVDSIHYLTPTDDNHRQTESLKRLGIFDTVNDEVGEIIVADVDADVVGRLVEPESAELEKLITKA
jgi:isocitrate lyase